jgi:hypothetical protein
MTPKMIYLILTLSSLFAIILLDIIRGSFIIFVIPNDYYIILYVYFELVLDISLFELLINK